MEKASRVREKGSNPSTADPKSGSFIFTAEGSMHTANLGLNALQLHGPNSFVCLHAGLPEDDASPVGTVRP